MTPTSANCLVFSQESDESEAVPISPVRQDASNFISTIPDDKAITACAVTIGVLAHTKFTWVQFAKYSTYSSETTPTFDEAISGIPYSKLHKGSTLIHGKSGLQKRSLKEESFYFEGEDCRDKAKTAQAILKII